MLSKEQSQEKPRGARRERREKSSREVKSHNRQKWSLQRGSLRALLRPMSLKDGEPPLGFQSVLRRGGRKGARGKGLKGPCCPCQDLEDSPTSKGETQAKPIG